MQEFSAKLGCIVRTSVALSTVGQDHKAGRRIWNATASNVIEIWFDLFLFGVSKGMLGGCVIKFHVFNASWLSSTRLHQLYPRTTLKLLLIKMSAMLHMTLHFKDLTRTVSDMNNEHVQWVKIICNKVNITWLSGNSDRRENLNNYTRDVGYGKGTVLRILWFFTISKMPNVPQAVFISEM